MIFLLRDIAAEAFCQQQKIQKTFNYSEFLFVSNREFVLVTVSP